MKASQQDGRFITPNHEQAISQPGYMLPVRTILKVIFIAACIALIPFVQALELKGCPESTQYNHCSNHSGYGLHQQANILWLQSTDNHAYIEIDCANDPGRDKVIVNNQWQSVQFDKYLKLEQRCSFVFRASQDARLKVKQDYEYQHSKH